MKIFNTLTRSKEDFVPLKANEVNLYACGVTVYDYCHIGHARTYTSVDIIIRYLQYRGFKVNYVRNITDIDDKIIKRAQENNIEYQEVTEKFTQAMHEDFTALQLLPPTHEPRATAYLPQMIKLIETLIAKDYAYVATNGDVYYAVRHFKNYGCLSHHDIEQLESGARVEVSDVKRDPLDFVLWKLAKSGEPAWDSPWGKGRAGWHLECSAMSMDLLGEHFDLHAGGRDLIFPHHENEIAQSEAATGKKFVNYWLHGGFLQIDKEKMSKSLGNFITVREVLTQYKPEVLRYLLLASHYRSPLIYADDALRQAQLSLDRLYNALRGWDLKIASVPRPGGPGVKHAGVNAGAGSNIYQQRFLEAMDDDFNTPIALSVLFDLAHEIQRLRDKEPVLANTHAKLLHELGGVLGILQTAPDAYFQTTQLNTTEIESLIAQRNLARQNKNWSEADKLRQALDQMGVQIEDSPIGTTWKYTR